MECSNCGSDDVRKICTLNPVSVYECLSCGQIFKKKAKEGENG